MRSPGRDNIEKLWSFISIKFPLKSKNEKQIQIEWVFWWSDGKRTLIITMIKMIIMLIANNDNNNGNNNNDYNDNNNVLFAFWFSCGKIMVRYLTSAAFWSEVLIRGRRLFWSECETVRCLLEGSAYLWPGAYQRKYGISIKQACWFEIWNNKCLQWICRTKFFVHIFKAFIIREEAIHRCSAK